MRFRPVLLAVLGTASCSLLPIPILPSGAPGGGGGGRTPVAPEPAAPQPPAPATPEPATAPASGPSSVGPAASPAPPAALPAAPPAAAPATPPAPRELPFDPSPEDRPHLGAAGFTGVAKVTLPDGSEALGPRVAGVRPGSGLEAAGVKSGDVLVSVAGTTLRPGGADAIGAFREVLLRQSPDTVVELGVWRDGEGFRTVRALLGRQPPPFARADTPADWMRPSSENASLDATIRAALALDGGAARFEDTLERNRRHSAKRDAFRLREVTEAHMNVASNEALAIEIAAAVSANPGNAARVAGGNWRESSARAAPAGIAEAGDVEAAVAAIAAHVGEVDRLLRAATAGWTADDRAFVAANFARLAERIDMGAYVVDDEDPSRERANRRTVALLSKVDRARLADAAAAAGALAMAASSRLRELAGASPRDGLLAARDTPAGRIEVWGRGNQRHTRRCAFLFDASGNDNYLDVAGRADLAQTVSIYVDAAGDDLWAATSPFGLAGALGGAGIVLDLDGDDQYLSRGWSQGAAAAGFAVLADTAGNDVYHAQDVGQGAGLAGAGVLADLAGDDLYTGVRFCQGVGFPGGVGALVDQGGDDRYVCTGRYGSEYGEPGLFSGWGQGCGFGFRQLASGGIGVLLDQGGDDVYEAGNFSQGGGYFYAWGILWDALGRDRYVGSRYAQGFAAHQAVGTFLEGAGDDRYQSHSGVAQGLSWDETSVVFHEMGGNDVYETSGFSLASAAHNGVVLLLEDGGDDVYAGLPAHAASNDYHGGNSFALFLDRGGNDSYAGHPPAEWNDRAAVRDDGAYHVDLPEGGEVGPRYLR